MTNNNTGAPYKVSFYITRLLVKLLMFQISICDNSGTSPFWTPWDILKFQSGLVSGGKVLIHKLFGDILNIEVSSIRIEVQ